MDSSPFFTFSAHKNANFSTIRHLPTYEEANKPYSLRLPTYRSSYIRRYHPYARYSASFVEERFMVEDVADHDDEESLPDLSILYEPIPQMHDALGDSHLAQSLEDQVGERRDELSEAGLVIVDPGVINGDFGEEQEVERDNVERSRQPSPFLRLDMPKSVILENM
ncbi:hypothetical protein APHAL10511_002458 [Amanita phalloides]|nr:hypothetical protein APHAL10511_002458 [Amanita phalloides]